METRRSVVAGLVLLAACGSPPNPGGAYVLRGNPWEQAAAEPDAASRPVPPAAKEAGPGAGTTGAATSPGTVLEQVEGARQRTKSLEEETARLKGDMAAQTVAVQELQAANKNLEQMMQVAASSRASVEAEFDQLRVQVKDLEARCRLLVDEVLAEKIQRVRVERELILSKVSEAEHASDGP